MEYLGDSNSYKVARLFVFDEDTVQTYIAWKILIPSSFEQ